MSELLDRHKLAQAPGTGKGAGGAASGSARYAIRTKLTVTRVEDPSGRGKPKFRADDGVLGHFVGSGPEVAIGATIEVWIANVGGGTYTLSTQPPKTKPR